MTTAALKGKTSLYAEWNTVLHWMVKRGANLAVLGRVLPWD